MSTILGDGRSSVFYRNIKDQKQLAFSIGASNAGFRDDGIFYVSANFTPGNEKKLEDAIFEEIANIQKNGVTPAQVALAKNIIERDTYYARESISNIAQEIGYTMVTANDIKMCIRDRYYGRNAMKFQVHQFFLLFRFLIAGLSFCIKSQG